MPHAISPEPSPDLGNPPAPDLIHGVPILVSAFDEPVEQQPLAQTSNPLSAAYVQPFSVEFPESPAVPLDDLPGRWGHCENMPWSTARILDLHRIYLANAPTYYTDEFLDTPERRSRAFRFTVNIYDFCDRVAWIGRDNVLTANLRKMYSDWIRTPIFAHSANTQSPRLNTQTQNLEIVAYSGQRKIPHRRPVDMRLEDIWYPADVGEPHQNILTTDLCPDTREGSLCCTFVLFQRRIYREIATKFAPRHLDSAVVLSRHSRTYLHPEARTYSEVLASPETIQQLRYYRCPDRSCGCKYPVPPHLRVLRDESDDYDIVRFDTEAGDWGGFEDVWLPKQGIRRGKVTNGGHTAELLDRSTLG